jgi:hypothetical protein
MTMTKTTMDSNQINRMLYYHRHHHYNAALINIINKTNNKFEYNHGFRRRVAWIGLA